MPGAGADAGVEPGKVGALYVGNMIAGQVSAQSHLGAQIADFAGYKGIEAFTVEAACASGGAAVRAGLMAVASGMHDIVGGCGGGKMTDSIGGRSEEGRVGKEGRSRWGPYHLKKKEYG